MDRLSEGVKGRCPGANGPALASAGAKMRERRRTNAVVEVPHDGSRGSVRGRAHVGLVHVGLVHVGLVHVGLVHVGLVHGELRC